MPDSACFKMDMIWLLVNLDVFMQDLPLILSDKILLLDPFIFRRDYPNAESPTVPPTTAPIAVVKSKIFVFTSSGNRLGINFPFSF